ncbi:dynein regulatory complex subunit 6 [Microcaecilia unicolor]|uniref:Leucine-rich repeat-containing protein 29 n=1 Tax=Microcaecilia unicolor TaxID=1415580 RepID=A0A6P7Y3Y7_9AMPH|nr:leucine-rich repeat-containing protein 29 [Microcaecilia unicolor]
MMGSQELPLEIISHILSFLPLSDWKEASLVNRTWYFAAQDSQLQRKVIYNLPASSSSLHTIQGLARRCAPCISLNNLDSSNVSRDVIKYISFYLGSHLESLSLRGSCLTDSSFTALIQNCPNLRSLDLSGCNGLFMSGTLLSKHDTVLNIREALNNLQELNLSGVRYLSDLIFNRLISCTPQLEKLMLARCHITFEFDPYWGSRNYNSSAVLSFRNILMFLKERANCMKALDLSSTGVTTEAVRSLIQVEHLNLRELALQNCKDLSSEAVGILCKRQPNLTSLNLSGCSELSDSAVLAASNHLRGLQHLYLAKVRRLTDIGLRGIADLRELRSLDLSECSLLNGSELVKGLSSPLLHPKLKMASLSFASCCLLKDVTVVSLAGSLGACLHVLDLSSCMALTDISIHAISTHLTRLTVLRLAWCKELTDWGLLGIINPDKELNPNTEKDSGPAFSRNFGNMGFFTPPQYLDEKPRLLTVSDLEKSREKPSPSLKSLQCLRELDLTACSKLTDTSITQVIQFPELKQLSLSLLGEISNYSLAALAMNCHCLEQLSLSHCTNLTDEGFQAAAHFLRRLQHLHLAGCNQLTDRCLKIIGTECKQLKSLDVSMCKNISMASVKLLQSQLPMLTHIQTRFLGGADLSFTL